MRVRDQIHDDRLPVSYYAATSNDTEGFLRLEGAGRAEVCIIGGGFTGIATALELAERGIEVALLEQNSIGWGASGRNGGQLLGGYGPDMDDFAAYEKLYGSANARAVWEMGIECVELVAERIQQYQIDCDLRWGYFDAAMNHADLKALEKSQATLVALGYRGQQQFLAGTDCKKIVGSDRFVGGLVNLGWGHLHPLNLVLGEARAAAHLGARLYEDARVSSINYTDDGVVVETGQGKVIAQRVVFAGGAYLGNLVPKIVGRIMPVGSHMVATEPLGDALAAEIMPQDYAVCDQRWALDYFRLSADKRLLFGGMATYSGKHPKNIEASMRGKMLEVFPQLGNTKIDYTWGGRLGVSLNRVPQIGKVADHAYYAQAYSGHGVAASHMSARLIAEAISGDTSRFSMVAGIKHRNFPGGKFLRQPLLALGMAYHQMLEALRR